MWPVEVRVGSIQQKFFGENPISEHQRKWFDYTNFRRPHPSYTFSTQQKFAFKWEVLLGVSLVFGQGIVCFETWAVRVFCFVGNFVFYCFDRGSYTLQEFANLCNEHLYDVPRRAAPYHTGLIRCSARGVRIYREWAPCCTGDDDGDERKYVYILNIICVLGA